MMAAKTFATKCVESAKQHCENTGEDHLPGDLQDALEASVTVIRRLLGAEGMLELSMELRRLQETSEFEWTKDIVKDQEVGSLTIIKEGAASVIMARADLPERVIKHLKPTDRGIEVSVSTGHISAAVINSTNGDDCEVATSEILEWLS